VHPRIFRVTSSGKTADAAFNAAVREAAQQPGQMGPQSSIGQKPGFLVINDRTALRDFARENPHDAYAAFNGEDGEPLCEDDAEWLADRLIEEGDSRIARTDDPAGALLLKGPGPTAWLFFGWAAA
jgi:hypothetical protein